MNKEKELTDLKSTLSLPAYDNFPDIELYMDQVLYFLSRYRSNFRDDFKLSSAMVNNYIKAELLPRAKGKKYSREHLAHLAIIMRLKQVLSVKDTGLLLEANKSNKTDKELYEEFCNMLDKSYDDIAQNIEKEETNLSELALSLAVQSYLSKILSEYIIDYIESQKPPEEKGGRKSNEKSSNR